MEQDTNYEFHRERMEEDEEKLKQQPSEDDLHIKAGLQFAGWDSDGDMEWIGTERQWMTYEDLDNELPNEVINLQVERD